MQSLILLTKIVESKPESGLLSLHVFIRSNSKSVHVYIFDGTFRTEGGIPPLVELLEFSDAKVQRAAAGALRTLAFKNDENKNQVTKPCLTMCLKLLYNFRNLKKKKLKSYLI